MATSSRQKLASLQDAVKNKTATVLAIEATRSRQSSYSSYCDQNIVLQTPEEDRCPPIPGENPLIDLLNRSVLLQLHQCAKLFVRLMLVLILRDWSLCAV